MLGVHRLSLSRFVSLTALIFLTMIGPWGAFGQANIYHDGWNDLNKNGQMDPYENPALDVELRINDLLQRMTIEEKTCQMATLYGLGRDKEFEMQLPTPEWKSKVFKDGIAPREMGL